MRLRRFALALLALALLLPLPAGEAQGINIKLLAIRYDLDRPDANPFYCNVGAFTPTQPGKLKTSGSSTTVTEVVASSLPLTPVVVGDTLKVIRNLNTPTQATDYTTLTAKASGASVTVDTAVNWDNSGNGYSFAFFHPVCGQAATDGWFSVSQYKDFNVVIQFQQGDLGGGLDWRVECRDGGEDATPNQVFPATSGNYQNIATAGTGVTASSALVGFERWESCRVGIRANTSDPSDAGANLERIRIAVVGTPGGGN